MANGTMTMVLEVGPSFSRITDYFGPWAIEQSRFQLMASAVKSMDLAGHIKSNIAVKSKSEVSAVVAGRDFDVTDNGVAVIPVTGVLMKHVSSLDDGSSTVAVRRQIRVAANDPRIKSIVLRIDSPGGTVSGTQDLADEVASANSRKPVIAYVEDLGASAAYWIASQAGKVYANESAMVGSIGVYMVVEDSSKMADQLGIIVYVVQAGEFKGMGTPGTEVTDDQLSEFQRLIDADFKLFTRDVAKGRKMGLDKIIGLADGRVHPAARAVKLGLLDGISTFDEVLSKASVASQARAETQLEGIIMAEQEVKQASLAELKAALPKATADFLILQLEKGATIQSAIAQWAEQSDLNNARLSEDNARLNEDKARLSEEIKLAKKMVGVPALASGAKKGSEEREDPIAEFNTKLEEAIKSGRSRAAAVRDICVSDPELHAAYVAAYNTRHGRKAA